MRDQSRKAVSASARMKLRARENARTLGKCTGTRENFSHDMTKLDVFMINLTFLCTRNTTFILNFHAVVRKSNFKFISNSFVFCFCSVVKQVMKIEA